MSPHPVFVEPPGELAGEWRTAEALFQALRFDDRNVIEAIRAERSPMSAKMVAKRFAELQVVRPRSPEDTDLMYVVVRMKVTQHPALRAALHALPRDARIIEDVTRRPRSESSDFWGARLVDGEWVGRNTLGNIWLQIRIWSEESP